MKYILVILTLLLCVSVVYPQGNMSTAKGSFIEKAFLLKTYTNYAAANADTSGWFQAVNSLNVASYDQAALILVATDSIQATFYVAAGNSVFGNTINKTVSGHTTGTGFLRVSAVDSISSLGDAVTDYSATYPIVKVFDLKAHEHKNILAGADRFKILMDMGNVMAMGTTTGRTLKVYFWGVKD